MTQKLLLAESLDLLRQCEIREYEADKSQQRIRSSTRFQGELGRLVETYTHVLEEYLRALEILNYIRHTALDDDRTQNISYNKMLAEFCAGKLNAYMERCERLVQKKEGILLPLDQVDFVTKPGYTTSTVILMIDGRTYPLTRKESTVSKECLLTDGSYLLVVKNLDDYSVAAPEVTIQMDIVPARGIEEERVRASCNLPCQCGWRKVIAVSGTATLQLQLRSSGLRDAHVDLHLQKLEKISGVDSLTDPLKPPSTIGTMAQSNLKPGVPATNLNPGLQCLPVRHDGGRAHQEPILGDDELAALASYHVPSDSLPDPSAKHMDGEAVQDPWTALENINVPHIQRRSNVSATQESHTIVVDPAGLTAGQRLGKLQTMLEVWPQDPVRPIPLPSDQEALIQQINALPLPNKLS